MWCVSVVMKRIINTVEPRQNVADDTFKCIFLKKNMNFDWYFTKCCCGINQIGADQAQAIILSNYGKLTGAYKRPSASMS